MINYNAKRISSGHGKRTHNSAPSSAKNRHVAKIISLRGGPEI